MRYQIRHAIVLYEYGANTILPDVNFEIHNNEKIAVVGRNGCGKTTLLYLSWRTGRWQGVFHSVGVFISN